MDNLNKLLATDANFKSSLTKNTTASLLSQKLTTFHNNFNTPPRPTDKFTIQNALLACDQSSSLSVPAASF